MCPADLIADAIRDLVDHRVKGDLAASFGSVLTGSGMMIVTPLRVVVLDRVATGGRPDHFQSVGFWRFAAGDAIVQAVAGTRSIRR